MVIVYKTGFVTYQIARRLVKIDKIGLVNLVLGDRVMPELIQHEAVTDKIVRQLERFLNDSEYSSSAVSRLRELPNLLGGTGASMRAAEQVARFL
jgi:lipid-A-disaccharide synthase